MTAVEQRILALESRPATVGSDEQRRQVTLFRHFAAINRFEGLTPSAVDERLLQLLVTGRISKQEYLDLCLTDARGTA